MGSENKIWIPFALVLISSAFTYYCLYKFWLETNDLKYTYNYPPTLSDGDPKLHAILIKGLPTL